MVTEVKEEVANNDVWEGVTVVEKVVEDGGGKMIVRKCMRLGN